MVVWGRLTLALLTLAGLLWPLYGPADDSPVEPDPARITAYRADFTLARDGRLDVRETISTRMPAKRHGIYRFWDVRDRADSHARLIPQGISITQDGRPARVDLSWQGVRRYRVARVGDPDRTLMPGRHVYTIRYHVDGAISSYDGGRSRLAWDLVPSGWQMSIAGTRLRVHLPTRTGVPGCGVGLTGGTACPVVQGAGTTDLTFGTGALAPRTAVVVGIPLTGPAPARVTLPWPQAVDGIASRRVPLAVGLLLLGIAGAVAGLVVAARTREWAPDFAPTWTPPVDVGPVQAAYLASERVPPSAVTATVLHLASRGLVDLERTEQGWQVTGAVTPDRWDDVDPVGRRVGEVLEVTPQGRTFAADGSAASGETLDAARTAAVEAVQGWALDAGMVTQPRQVSPRVLFWVAVALAVVGFAFNPWQVTLMGLAPALFAFGAVPSLRPGWSTRRTPAGRELWSRVGGFERTLAGPAGRDRWDVEQPRDVYAAALPWAVAFGHAEGWRRSYESDVREHAPMPVWLSGGAGGSSAGTQTSAGMVHSFQSSVESSIGAYQASAASVAGSSGGGAVGGFGGGGGGGGGGSW